MRRRLVAAIMAVAGALLPPPAAVATAPKHRLAYVSKIFSSTISVFDLDAMEWLRDFEAGAFPMGLDPDS